MKRLLAICGAMGTMLIFGNVASATPVDLSILPASSTVGVGDTIDLELWATSSPSGQSIAGISPTIGWDTGNLQYLGYINEIGFPPWYVPLVLYPNPGEVQIDGSYLGGTVPTDVLVYTLQFQALAATSSTPVDIVTAIVRDGSNTTITGTLTGAEITIVPEPSTALLFACGLAGLAVVRRQHLHH